MNNRKVALLVFAIGMVLSLIGAFSVTGNVIGTSKIYFDAFKIIVIGLMAA